MKKFFKKFFKKKSNTTDFEFTGFEFTGFEVKLWEDGKLIAYTIGNPDEILAYHFPCDTFLKTPNGNILKGYNLVPHLERI